MPLPPTKFFTQNGPNVEAFWASQNVSDGFLQTATDQSKASVLAPDPTLHGLNNSDPAALVINQTRDAMSHNKSKPPLLSTDDLVQPDAKLEHKKIEAPVLFRGMAPLLHPVNNLEMKILPVSSSANSANLNTKSLKAPVAIGSAISLVPNMHARSTVRTLILGSLSMICDRFSIRLEKSGNEKFLVEHERPGYTRLFLSRQITLWPLEMHSVPPLQNTLGWWCIHVTINSSSLEDHIGCKASPGTEDDGVAVSCRYGLGAILIEGNSIPPLRDKFELSIFLKQPMREVMDPIKCFNSIQVFITIDWRVPIASSSLKDPPRCKMPCLDDRESVQAGSANGVAFLQPSFFARWLFTLVAEHYRLSGWGYQCVPVVCNSDMDAYEVRQFSLIPSQCSPAPMVSTCLSIAEKLQEPVEMDYTQLPPNHKVLLKSVNPPASKPSAVKYYNQTRGCQAGRENSGQNHICFPQAHWSDFQGISSHGQVSSSCTFSHDSTAKLQDACPIPRRVDVMKLTIENGPNFVQFVSYAASSCDPSLGFEMTIRIPDVRTGITLQIKEEIMLWESINGVALSISFSSWWQPHHDRISLPDAIWHFPSLVLLEGCDDVQAASCNAIRNMMSDNDPVHKEIMLSHRHRFLHHFKTCQQRDSCCDSAWGWPNFSWMLLVTYAVLEAVVWAVVGCGSSGLIITMSSRRRNNGQPPVELPHIPTFMTIIFHDFHFWEKLSKAIKTTSDVDAAGITSPVTHVLYSCLAVGLAMTKNYSWRKWEYQASALAADGNLQAKRNKMMRQQNTLAFHHASHPWSRNRVINWMLWFLRQFTSFIRKSDYLALRFGIVTHN
ncbi:hypothetical protein Nepgr_014113 [Nepenthes gracilis]|uniref:OST48 N-terminal domain-containing protein n=1 Tax=Nepenthes gracilis TaxID=150966 RepID=A0AAD3SKF9_NEPGR|nr:hypothetical protein Nepgr_014113 [Nepenthes gracilis]